MRDCTDYRLVHAAALALRVVGTFHDVTIERKVIPTAEQERLYAQRDQ